MTRARLSSHLISGVHSRYLYTGDFSLEGDPSSSSSSADKGNVTTHLDELIRLGQEFGTPNALETDLRYLMETGDLADAVLVFASGQDFTPSNKATSANGGPSTSSTTGPGGPASDYGFFPWLEIPCHKAILSARSPFFRSLIQRRMRTAAEAAVGNVAAGPLRIVLDESVIPRRYARVLMQALYLDTVDMNCVVRPPPVLQQPVQQTAQPSQQHAQQQLPQQAASDEVLSTASVLAGSCTAAGAGPTSSPPRPAAPTLFEEATELYQVRII